MTRLIGAVPVLTAVDVATDSAFWVERLGFTGGLVDDGFARLRRDDIEIFIAAVSDQVVPDNTMAWLRVTDLDGLHAEWSRLVPADRSEDGTVVTPISERPWGREFVVIDPAGNCVHVSPAAV